VAVLKGVLRQLDPDVVRPSLDDKMQGALLDVDSVTEALDNVKKKRRNIDERAVQTAFTTGAAGANDTPAESL
jgi:hypothetical protein